MVLAAEIRSAKRPVPPGWRWVRLGEACTLVTDGTHYSPKDTGGPFPFLTVKDMNGGGLEFSKCSHVDADELDRAERAAACPKPGDVLFSKDGTVGKVHHVTEDQSFAVLSSIAILRPDTKLLDGLFLAYLLRSPEILSEAINRKTGSALRRIILDDIKQIEFPLPPMEEQKRISATLNEQMPAVERARAAAEAQLEAAKALRAAYLHAVFSSPEAQQWPQRMLGEIALIVQNGIYKTADNYGHGHPFLRMYNIQNDSWKLTLEPLALVALAGSERITFGLKNGDLLISRVNSYELVGKCAWVGSEAEGYVFENMLIRVRLDQSVDSLFVAQQFATCGVREQIESVAKRAIGQASINSEDVRSIRLVLPALADQQRIAAMLNGQMASPERARKAIEEELQTINKLPAALLRRAFSGEL